MATTWLQKANFTRRSFLLTNGEHVLEPELEESSTGRKIRLAGTTQSFYARDEHQLIRDGLDMLATQRKARFWMPIDLTENLFSNKAGFTPTTTRAVFQPTTTEKYKATAWWSFRHPSIPEIKALLFVRWHHPNGYAESHQIQTRLVVQDQAVNGLYPLATVVADDNFAAVKDALPYDERLSFEEFVRDYGPSWTDGGLFDQHTGLAERGAVSRLFKKVRLLEELDEIQIPDLRERHNAEYGWLTLKLHDTNVTGRFLQDMEEYLSGEGIIEHAKALYRELVETFKSIGMVMESSIDDGQMMEAMLNGDQEALTVKLATAVNEQGEKDVGHTVSVHLPTGTFVVTCKKEPTDKDKIAHAWEESLVMASLTGQEDVLLAYAKEYVRTEHDRRTNKIVERRKTSLDLD